MRTTRRTVVDLFAGGGGFSTAAKLAGCDVLAAVNHNPEVVAIHAENHPETMHGCYALNADTNYAAMPDHDILIASPCCQGHSHSRGKDKPDHDTSRATLLAVTSAVHAKKPKVVIVENVPEVREWGENKDGTRYKWWLAGMALEGYHISENVLEAADFGAGSRRERLFILMVHKSVSDAPVWVENPKLPWVPAREVIDTSGKYDRKFTPIADKCRKTRDKYARQYAKGMPTDRDWVFCYRGKGYGYELDETICTITTVAQWCLVRGDKSRFLTPAELRKAMDFPADYKMPKRVKTAIKFLGNAVNVKVAKAVIETAVGVIDRAAVRAADGGRTVAA